jgi:nicotinamide phosphoribosyltransferase
MTTRVSNTKENPLLALDVYKMGHMEQYIQGCNKVYSYLIARSDKTFDKTVFFGLQYYLKEYLSTPITPELGEEFLVYRKAILGSNSEDVEKKIRSLCKLGYFPLEIKSVEEGTVMPVRNVLMTIVNTNDEFHWVVGFVESLLLKLWYSITVASCCYKYRGIVEKYFNETVDKQMHFLKDFTVHDFGYRGDSSEEYYNSKISDPIMYSVPASEHSVVCSFGKEDELASFRNMLRLYPSGIVSVVSDTFNVYRVLTEFAEILKPEILARDGKVVFRPDSGNPEYIICGDPNAVEGSNEWKGAIRLLDEMFGSTVNKLGYKMLNPKIGLLYGDGMYMERYVRTLERLKEMGYASSNLVIGVGGILRNHSRDTIGFAIKATYIEVNGVPKEIEKDPITDQKKKSHKGLLSLKKNGKDFITEDRCTWEQEAMSELKTVFKDGKLLRETDLQTIRETISENL